MSAAMGHQIQRGCGATDGSSLGERARTAIFGRPECLLRQRGKTQLNSNGRE